MNVYRSVEEAMPPADLVEIEPVSSTCTLSVSLAISKVDTEAVKVRLDNDLLSLIKTALLTLSEILFAASFTKA